LTEYNITRSVREISTLASVDDYFLHKLIGFSILDDKICIVDYHPNGRLSEVLCHSSKKWKLTSLRKTAIAIGVAQGMKVLHSKDIEHRNLNASTILIRDNYLPVITGFSSSRSVDPYYSSSFQTISSKSGPKETDVYSYGFLLWELAHNQTPYSDDKYEDGFLQ
jgi:serine/threonine protein kinase